MFAVNEGPLDRGLRVVLGATLLWLGYASGILTSPFSTMTVIIGAVVFVTGVTGFCGLYKLLNINTCGRPG